MEVAHFLVKVLGPMEGKKKMDVFMGYPLRVLDFDLETQRLAVDLLCEYSHLGIGARDAAILAMLKKKGIKTIMTHDAAIKKVEFVKAIDNIPAEVY